MSPETYEKRRTLKELSDKVVTAAIGTRFEELGVNELLMRFVYNREQKLTFKSFNKWKAEGFKVKKGEKAFLLWAEPKDLNEKKNREKKEGDTQEPEELFFPLAFVFSSEQVEPMKNK